MMLRGYIVPGKPLPLLAPGKHPAWAELRAGFDKAREEIAASGADLLLLYSTSWINVIGHQIQADPEPEWVHVDADFHDFGTMPYRFRMDADFAKACEAAARARGLHARTVAYKGFPLDSGVIQALKLLDPDNAIPACVLGCNMYADRAETIVWGKAAAEAVAATGRKAVAIAISAFSNRVFPRRIDPKDDRLYSAKDDEWNRKVLEMLGEGRLEDVSQVARDFATQAHGEQRGKAFWWLAATLGQHNGYDGTVHAYGPLWGSGGAVVGLVPNAAKDLSREFDEGDVQTFQGDRSVLAAAAASAGAPAAPPEPPTPLARTSAPEGAIRTTAAPKPVGAYPHARREGDLIFVSGIGPRQPDTDAIPGGPIRDANGQPRDYDAAAQTRAVIENIRVILESAGSGLDRIVDCQCFLIDMARDFAAFNAVYAEYFTGIQATRTTVEVRALPTPIAVEMKVIARA
jgi:2-aminophenol/2-amino-5-chlorophenol 1,6-dioxygenase alpha subunit